jgi:hypothetical protein
MSDAAALTPQAIRPLVSHQRASGRHLIVTFTCPQSGRHVNAQWTAPPPGLGQTVASRAKQSAWVEVRRQVHGLLRSVLGSGSVGRIATQTLETAMSQAPQPTSTAGLSAAEQEEGLVAAFQTVSGQFVWVQGRWVHASVAPELQAPLDAQLDRAPLAGRYDRLLLARMLVAVAGAHGGISDEEQGFLADALDPELGSLAALTRRPPLTDAELGEASPGDARVSMLTVAWSLALCDERLAVEEADVIERLADGLGLSRDARSRARDMARSYLLDQALERMFAWGGHDQAARDELVALGERIGLTREQVELAEARFQRRRA